ncbi:Membrane protein related to metalloendopeptidases [Candidatus Blochmanniella floridana]|uniref:Membrane protein related to metalloendopeptidases n=1 Tax=Blochmanniella floridana TaxID=203907 RepID=Q7VQX9_BLOFL|nr:Membrane protein related to metalloendopeptidases [Candidatus Blochmannia floridanus]
MIKFVMSVCIPVFRSIKLIYHYLYKRCFMMLSTIFLIIIIMIIWNIFVINVLNKNKKKINKICISNEYTTLSQSLVSVHNNQYYNKSVDYLKFVKNQFYSAQSVGFFVIYDYFVSSSNDALIDILKCYNDKIIIDIDCIYQLINQYPILNNLKSGQLLSWVVSNKKQLQSLIWCISDHEIHIYNNMKTFFTQGIVKVFKRSNNRSFYTVLFVGKVNGTFINSARSLGIEKNCISDVIKSLQYQLDFKKLRQGDKFAILVSFEDNDSDNLKIKLIGARLHTAGKDYYVFRASNGRFYNRDAIEVGSNFFRFPILKPYRISSNFNLNRLNPITGQVTQHTGVDFAVPIGTPVFSIGDGEVIISKYSKVAGNYVVIKHNHQCITRYMHLQKLLVKSGQKIKRGDSIAFSGNTGRSTGPHLHFEIWINHRPVNPLTANLLSIEKLSGKERIKYLNQIHEIIPQLYFD